MPAKPPAPKPAAPAQIPVWLCVVAIILAGVAAYCRSLNAPFVFDDIPAVLQNESIRDLSEIGRILNPPAQGAGVDSRPIINLSLALNHAIGGLNPWGYRATNITLHVLGALALFGLVRRTLALPAMPERTRSQATPIAFATALLWTVHPLQSETVICIVQRTEGIVSLLYLSMFYCFVRAVEPGGSRRWLAGAWIACLLGMASKEVMVTAPLLVFLYDRTFAAGTFREAWRQRGRWHAAFAATWLLLAWLVIDSGGSRGGTAGFDQGVSPWTYLLTQARALTIYLKLSVWPNPLIVDYGSWLAPGLSAVAGEFLFITLLFAGTVIAVVRRPRLGFLGACFFAILAPSSSVYPLVSQTIAEHRMHLPLAAVLALLVIGLFYLPRRLALALCLLAVIPLGLVTVRRGADYASELTLWTDLVEKTPSNPWARFNLAKTYFHLGRFAEAEQENRAATQLNPAHIQAHFALGLALERQQRGAEAAASYRRVLELKPDYAEAHFRLGLILLTVGRPEEAMTHFSETVRLKPDHADAEGNWSAALFHLGRPSEAIPHLERVLVLRPNSADAHYNLALILARLDRHEAALPHFEAAARLSPVDAEIALNFVHALLRSDRQEEAKKLLYTLLQAHPGNESAQRLLQQLERPRS